jgi:hypothetical protein
VAAGVTGAATPFAVPAVSGGIVGTSKFITDRLITDPDFLKSFSYAMKNHIPPRTAGPLLWARMIANYEKSKQQPPQPQTRQPSTAQPDRFMAEPNPKGLIQPGNINIMDRPSIPNPEEGGASTVFSTSVEMDGKHYLIPRVSDGKDGKPPHVMSEPEAIAYFKKTGEHLGAFDSDEAADNYGRDVLHEQQSKLKVKNGRTVQ